jgi:hypothetical protein
MESDLQIIVAAKFDLLIKKYELKLVPVDANELFLASQKATFWIPADRDGLSISAVRKGGLTGYLEYPLGLFLGERASRQKKPWPGVQFQTRREQLEAEAAMYAWYLQNFGQDILQGGDSWIREFTGEHKGGPYRLNPKAAAILENFSSKRGNASRA